MTDTARTQGAYDDAELEVLRSDPEMAAMFIAEGLDHLGTIESLVLQLESTPGDLGLLNDIFRPFHTVKGNAGALGVVSIQELAHRVENLLVLARSGQLTIGPSEADAVLRSVDILTTMITDLNLRIAGQTPRDVMRERAELMVTLEAMTPATDGHGGTAAAPPAQALPPMAEPSTAPDALAPPAPASVATTAPVVAVPAAPIHPPAPQASDAPRRVEDLQTSIKVDTRKLDGLVEMVGELVIVQSIIHANPTLTQVADERLTRQLSQLRRITTDLQRTAMSMRMVPIRQTFQKMARLVRDLSKKSGKPVELVLSGEDTELDRKVVEDINDPLMHMIRNSVDHGIESLERRREAGKREAGRLSLSAYHQGGNIVISIADDGGGLPAAKIRAKAIAAGIISEQDDLTPAEINQLIFQPGFSTADKVTEISGRGVGMDVVRRNIEALRGRIDIQTALGEGTTFDIKLPLTLAIVDGLVVAVGAQRFVLPTFTVRESLRPKPEQLKSVQGDQCLIQVRDSLVPLVSLASLFGMPTDVHDPSQGTVVVIEDNGRPVALVVDALIGKQEVVIKSLGETFANVRGIAGGAILGDGRVGLIIDGSGIVNWVTREAARAA